MMTLFKRKKKEENISIESLQSGTELYLISLLIEAENERKEYYKRVNLTPGDYPRYLLEEHRKKYSKLTETVKSLDYVLTQVMNLSEDHIDRKKELIIEYTLKKDKK